MSGLAPEWERVEPIETDTFKLSITHVVKRAPFIRLSPIRVHVERSWYKRREVSNGRYSLQLEMYKRRNGILRGNHEKAIDHRGCMYRKITTNLTNAVRQEPQVSFCTPQKNYIINNNHTDTTGRGTQDRNSVVTYDGPKWISSPIIVYHTFVIPFSSSHSFSPFSYRHYICII